MINIFSALQVSTIVGLLSVLFGLPFAVYFGWLLARCQFRGKSLLTLLLFLPLCLPPVVTGVVLLRLFGRNSMIGSFFTMLGLPLSFSLAGAIVAALIVGFPLFIMMVRGAIEAVDPRYEEMAKTLGLSRWQIFRKVTLPLSYPGVLAGAVVAFARAMGEFGATSILAGNIEGETRTISLALYALFEIPQSSEATDYLIFFGVLLAFLSLAAYELLLRFHRRRLNG